MPDLKITQLPELAAVPDSDDLFHVIDDPAGSPANKKTKFDNVTKEVKKTFALSGDITPAEITSDQDDYNPTDLDISSTLRLSSDDSWNITGLQGGADGRLLLIHNVGSNDIVLKDEDANSTVANRFALVGDLTLRTKESVILQYDSTSSRWRAFEDIMKSVPLGATQSIRRNAANDGWEAYNAGIEWGGLETVNGRLTLTSGTPVTISDVTAATEIFFELFEGNRIMLNVAGTWVQIIFTPPSIKITDAQTGDTHNGTAVIDNMSDTSQLIVGMEVSGTGVGVGAVIVSIDSATQITVDQNSTASATVTITSKVPANQMLDIFGYLSGSDLKLEMVATSRSINLTTDSGVYIKTGDAGRRYLGSIETTATAGQTEDSEANRLVWNYYNRVLRKMLKTESTDNWDYGTSTFRAANGNSGNRLAFVCGIAEDIVTANVVTQVNLTTGEAGNVGIGVDSTSVDSSDMKTEALLNNAGTTTINTILTARYQGTFVGYHTLTWLEFARLGTCTFFGDGGIPSNIQSGITGEIWA